MDKQKKIFFGLLSLTVGFTLAILTIDFLAKPDNIPVSLKLVESLEAYFFSFAFTMGIFGWILGSLILTIYLAAFYILGTRLYKLISKN